MVRNFPEDAVLGRTWAYIGALKYCFYPLLKPISISIFSATPEILASLQSQCLTQAHQTDAKREAGKSISPHNHAVNADASVHRQIWMPMLRLY